MNFTTAKTGVIFNNGLCVMKWLFEYSQLFIRGTVPIKTLGLKVLVNIPKCAGSGLKKYTSVKVGKGLKVN